MNHITIAIPIYGQSVAPRVDLTSEVVLVLVENGKKEDERLFVLPQASSEEFCQFILKEGVKTVICGGIEEEFLRYLEWKNVEVIDNVIGKVPDVVERYLKGELKTGDMVGHEYQG
jgi:predicted Fe-Mo cluster-binding NifX family protein